MKTKRNKKISSVMLGSLLTLLLVFLVIPAVRTEAASTPVCEKKMTVYFTNNDLEGSSFSANLFIGNMTKNAKIQNIKSSNKKISADTEYCLYTNQLKLSPSINKKGSTVYYRLKNNEKTTISFTVVQGGKKYRLSCQVTFKKSKSSGKNTKVLSSLKLGGKEYIRKTEEIISNGQFFGYYLDFDEDKFKTKNIELSVKMKKGYKLELIEVGYGYGTKVKKNGSSIDKSFSDITVYWCSSIPKYFDQTKLNTKKAKKYGYSAAQAKAHTVYSAEVYYWEVPIGG